MANINRQILENIERFDGASDITVAIAIGGSAKAKSWETMAVPWPKLVSALSIPLRTDETYAEYKSLSKASRSRIKDVGGFMGGRLSGPRRLNEAVTSRSLITLDFDGPAGNGLKITLDDLFAKYAQKFDNEAVFYTTHTHEAEAPRVRLIIPMASELDPGQYAAVSQGIAAELGSAEVDAASYVLSQFMFWPSASKDGEFEFRHIAGEILDPTEILNHCDSQVDPIDWAADKREKTSVQPLERGPVPEETRQKVEITRQEATQAVFRWVNREFENLQEYQNFIAALMVIVKAVQDREISHRTGRACAELLAAGRDDWKQLNVEKFEKELENPSVSTAYSFRKKFMHGVTTADEDFEFDEGDLVCYQDIAPQSVQWLWPGYIPLGMLTTIQGDPGGGKTYVSTGLTAGITNGVLPPDDFGTPGSIPPRNVLFINGEDSPEHTIRPRLDQAGANPAKVFTLKIDKDPLDFSQIKRIEAAVKRVNPLLVVFDPIQQFLGAGVDMHKANEVRPVLARLKELAAEYSFACVFVMHMNKYGGGKAQYRGLGSIDISAIMRSQLLVGENRNTPGGRLVVPIKNSLGKLQPAQGFTITDMGLAWTGPDFKATEEDVLLQANAKEGTELDEAIKWIRDLLSVSPAWSTELETAAAAEGISNRTLRRARDTMKDKWEIDCKKAPGIKKWFWTKTHRKILFKENQTLEYEEEEPFGQVGQVEQA